MINNNLICLVILNIFIRYDCMYVERLGAILIDQELYKYFYYYYIIIKC